MALEAGICLAAEDKVINNADDTAYDAVIDTLAKKSRARVVVCFCEGMTVRSLLQASKRKKVSGKFLFIGRSVLLHA